MDINCTNKCLYQADGKCNLNQLPSANEISYDLNNNDCPYFLGND